VLAAAHRQFWSTASRAARPKTIGGGGGGGGCAAW